MAGPCPDGFDMTASPTTLVASGQLVRAHPGTASAILDCPAEVREHTAYQVTRDEKNLVAMPQRAAEQHQATPQQPEPWLAEIDALIIRVREPPVTEMRVKRWWEKLKFWDR
jgi:hypothetical protein